MSRWTTSANGSGAALPRMRRLAGATALATLGATFLVPMTTTLGTARPAEAAEPAVRLMVVDADAYGATGAVFRLDTGTGEAVRVVSGSPLQDPFGIAVDADRSLLLADRSAYPGNHGALFRVDQGTKVITPITSERHMYNPTGVAVAPDGTIFVVDADAIDADGDAGAGAVIRVDPETAEQSLVSVAGVFGNPNGIAIEPRGDGYDLLVADTAAFGGDGGVIRVDPVTGTQTAVARTDGNKGDFGDPMGLTVAPNGDVYVIDRDWDGGDGGVIRLAADTIEPGMPPVYPTVANSEVSGPDSWGNPTGITLASDGLLYVADPDYGSNGAVFSVDPATRTTTLVSTDGEFDKPTGLVEAPSGPPAPVPVPTGPYAPFVVTNTNSWAPCTYIVETYDVPVGVTRLGVRVAGQPGEDGDRGNLATASTGSGGFGAVVTGILPLDGTGPRLYASTDTCTGGDPVRIDPDTGKEASARGPFGGAGGDLSFVALETFCPSCEIAVAGLAVVAGGGGGGGSSSATHGGTGGDAGTQVGTNGRSGGSGGEDTNRPGRGGGAGTLTTGGAGGPETGYLSWGPDALDGLPGSRLQGGDAPFPREASDVEYYTGGGAGGGGWWGGGSGGQGYAAGGGGGGGGSSWWDSSVLGSARTYLAPTRRSEPSVTLTPLNVLSDVELITSAGTVSQGQDVTFTATVSPAPSVSPLPADPGTMTFTLGGAALGTAAVDATTGVATLTTRLDTRGSFQVAASYGGNGFVEPSTGRTDLVVNGSAPQWTSPTPGEGAVVDATPGEPVTVGVRAGDPDGPDTVTLTAPGRPAGSTFTTTPSNPASGTLAWTPSEEGETALTFAASDGRGNTVQRHMTIRAAKKSPTIVWSTPASITYGQALGDGQLDAALSTAPGAATPPHPGTLTYDPAAGTVPHAGDQSVSVTWQPDPADFAGWRSVTANVTLRVNRAGQTLAFVPAIDDSTAHSYGDAPFTVTAVSSAGLPVTYAVADGDACTSTLDGAGGTTITITGAGPCTLSVDQAGDGDHFGASTLTHSFTIAKQTPTIEMSPADTVYGTALDGAQLDATLSPAEAAEHGTVTWTVDGEPLPDDRILGAGTHTLTATYTPDDGSSYNGTSVSADFEVAAASQTIIFDALDDATFGDPAFTVSASATSDLPVSFTSTTPSVCSVGTGGTVSLLHAGTCSVTASQPGDDNHLAAAPVTRSFGVAEADQTITFEAPGDRTYLDAPVALQAAGGGSGNPVTFVAGPAGVCTLVGGTTLSLTGAGECTVTASQAGDADHRAAADVTRTITVAKAVPTISWPAPSTISYGTALGTGQLDAEVSPDVAGTFTYTLADGTTSAGGKVLHAADTPYTLKVSFEPSAPDDANFTSATGRTTITVTQAEQAISWGELPDLTYGDAPFPVPVSGGASGNPVRLTVQAGSACTVEGHSVTITAAGSCVLDADQAGDEDYRPAPTSTRSLTAARRTPTITWDPPASITYGTPLGDDQLDARVAPAEAADHGTLAYTAGAVTGPAAGQRLHAGTHTLTAGYTPDDAGPGASYTAATATTTITVERAEQSITFPALDDATYGDGPLRLSATGGGSGNPVTFTTGSGSTCSVSGTSLVLTGAGSCSVTARQEGDADHLAATDVTRTFAIGQAQQTITFVPDATAAVGDPAVTLTAAGGASGNPVTFTGGPAATCSVTTTGVLTVTGPGVCTVTASQAGNDDYAAAASVVRAVTVSYTVAALGGADEVHVAGGVVPITVTLTDAAGRSLAGSTVVLHATRVDDDGEPAWPGNSQPGGNFRYSPGKGGSYRFNLDISGLEPGTHRLWFTVTGDPTEHAVTFTIVAR